MCAKYHFLHPGHCKYFPHVYYCKYQQACVIPCTAFSRLHKRLLAALLSFAQIDLGTETVSPLLYCDCSLYEFREFVMFRGQGRNLTFDFQYFHVSHLSDTNFQTWKCSPHRILGRSPGSIFHLNATDFLCENNSLGEFWPRQCKIYTQPNLDNVYVDCFGADLHEIPQGLIHLNSTSAADFVVSLESNSIASLVDCSDGVKYGWLHQVTKLVLSDNRIAVSSMELERFLSCLISVKELYLDGNHISSFPPSLTRMNLSELAIDNNPLTCCGSIWMKSWLQNQKDVVRNAKSISCNNKGERN